MKKVATCFCVILVAIFTFVSCATTSSVELVYDQNEVFELAKQHSQSLISGEYAEVAKDFSDEVAAQLDETALKTVWEDTVTSLGAYVEHVNVAGGVSEEFYTCSVVEKFENGGLKITLTYNIDDEIAGIFFAYESLEEAEENDAFEEVSVTVGEEYPLEGLLTLPKNVENPPVVLLVHGSGQSDKNETIYQNTPFKDIAHGLAESGIASLRYDKRFYAHSGVDFGEGMGIYEEVLEDVEFALDLLKNDARVDHENIYVLGHSLGGMLTPYIAYENDYLAGIISMAGTLRPLYEVQYSQNMAIKDDFGTGLYTDETEAIIEEQLEQVEIDIEILRGDMTDVADDTSLLGLSAGYQKSAKQYAGENFIDDIALPILVLQGEEDFQIFPDIDYKLWEETLKDRDNVTLKLYPGLNHLMMQSNGKSDLSEYEVKAEVSPDVIDDIVEFIGR